MFIQARRAIKWIAQFFRGNRVEVFPTFPYVNIYIFVARLFFFLRDRTVLHCGHMTRQLFHAVFELARLEIHITKFYSFSRCFSQVFVIFRNVLLNFSYVEQIGNLKFLWWAVSMSDGCIGRWASHYEPSSSGQTLKHAEKNFIEGFLWGKFGETETRHSVDVYVKFLLTSSHVDSIKLYVSMSYDARSVQDSFVTYTTMQR